jgi:phage portal protein BeeE
LNNHQVWILYSGPMTTTTSQQQQTCASGRVFNLSSSLRRALASASPTIHAVHSETVVDATSSGLTTSAAEAAKQKLQQAAMLLASMDSGDNATSAVEAAEQDLQQAWLWSVQKKTPESLTPPPFDPGRCCSRTRCIIMEHFPSYYCKVADTTATGLE